jgi:NAD(P) transhydrogenase subunit beta
MISHESLNLISISVIGASDLAAAFLFMFGLKRMSSPVTAPSGIRFAGYGMAVAVASSFLYIVGATPDARPHLIVNVSLAVAALLIGGTAAWLGGKKVAMTSMPQMVALYNGMGGGAAASIAAVQLLGDKSHGGAQLLAALCGAVIGSLSFSGSLIAWAKLEGVLKKPLRFLGQRAVNAVAAACVLAVGAAVVLSTHGAHVPRLSSTESTAALFGGAMLLGILATLPIGGADMPVVISIYNALTGVAVGLDGFVLQNPALMIAGMVVGAAGLLLTLLMAKAMNRSVRNILFSDFGEVSKHERGAIKGALKPTAPADAAIAMRYAHEVIIVPGYGLAAAQGQQKLYEFVKLLQAAGVTVKFAIHPVAGRMPGQMDVLLAEAGVPYDLIFQLDAINPEFKNADFALVVGANDVVNPAARTDKGSPIFGMPILNADQAKKVYVIKRGEGKGYAGIVNALFYEDNCNMVYGDASAVLAKMIEAVRGLGDAGKPAAKTAVQKPKPQHAAV